MALSTPPPPPPPPPSTNRTADDERAARLEQLARRRAAAMTPETTTPSPSGKRRRAHPARGARRAALGMSLLTTAGLAGLFATSGPSAGSSGAAIVASGIATAPSDQSPSTSLVAAPVADAVVDGGTFHNRWGDVQVRATFSSDGALVDVAALLFPNDRTKSVRINDWALPRLTTEAISSQTASVDTVSGATYTSDGYRRSLQSAIDVARAAGITVLS